MFLHQRIISCSLLVAYRPVTRVTRGAGRCGGAVSGSSMSMSSSTTSGRGSHLNPAEAGQLAYEVRCALEDDVQPMEDTTDTARAALLDELKRDIHGTRPRTATIMDTVLAHTGLEYPSGNKNRSYNEPLSPVLATATTYERPPSGAYPEGGHVYTRTSNPTRDLLERAVARLEVTHRDRTAAFESLGSRETPGPTCSAFSSGMAAVSAVLLAHSHPCHVILPDDCYHGVPTQLVNVLNRHGIEHSLVDMTNHEAVKEELDRVQSEGGGNINSYGKKPGSIVLWIETPSNPLARVTDIRSLCQMVHGDKERAARVSVGSEYRDITVVVDATWMTPCITQPLLLGADAVLHSGTKYFGGHSDVTLGVVTCSSTTPRGRWLGPTVKQIQSDIGSIASPFDCWLCLRGMRTMGIRLERQCRTAMEWAVFLDSHPLVTRTHYPGLPSHPQHDVASRQMSCGYGGMLSFELADEATAMAVAGAVRVIKRATSLGGTETLIEHRASIEPKDRVTSPPGLLRVSVGLEDVEDLKHDLEMAFIVARTVVGPAT